VPTAVEIRALKGQRVTLKLAAGAGLAEVTGTVTGTVKAADGLVVFVDRGEGEVFSCNYQHIVEVSRQG